MIRGPPIVEPAVIPERPTDAGQKEDNSDDEVDIETTEDDPVTPLNASLQNLHSASNSAMSSHSGRSTSPQCWSPPRETVSSDLGNLLGGLSGGLRSSKNLWKDADTYTREVKRKEWVSPEVAKRSIADPWTFDRVTM